MHFQAAHKLATAASAKLRAALLFEESEAREHVFLCACAFIANLGAHGVALTTVVLLLPIVSGRRYGKEHDSARLALLRLEMRLSSICTNQLHPRGRTWTNSSLSSSRKGREEMERLRGFSFARQLKFVTSSSTVACNPPLLNHT